MIIGKNKVSGSDQEGRREVESQWRLYIDTRGVDNFIKNVGEKCLSVAQKYNIQGIEKVKSKRVWNLWGIENNSDQKTLNPK